LKLSEEYGVTTRTIERDANFSKGLDAIAEVKPEFQKLLFKKFEQKSKTFILIKNF